MTDIVIPLEALQPPVPVTVAIWSSRQCAIYFDVSRKQFMDNIASHPDFPEPVEIKTKRGKLRPRWKAMDVIKYVERK